LFGHVSANIADLLLKAVHRDGAGRQHGHRYLNATMIQQLPQMRREFVIFDKGHGIVIAIFDVVVDHDRADPGFDVFAGAKQLGMKAAQ